MKAIIENGKVNYEIQSCFIGECGIGIVFHNSDLAERYTNQDDGAPTLT